ncbi:MAG: tRNA uracil 4-sulfurtransferase ThiI [Campylobacterota bacterium]
MQESKRQKFIVKFFPEIMVKGVKTKRQMIGQLYNNLKLVLNRLDKDITVVKFSDKIEVECTKEIVDEVRVKLKDTAGIEVILEVLQYDNITTLDEIKQKVNEITSHKIQNRTFVVRAKRSGTHEFRSTDIEQNVGGFMLANNDTKGVDLRDADVTINLELIDKKLNIVTNKYKGLSGFPIGTQGSILSLMSGGFDSTVASYMTMKRGLKTHFIFFNLGGLAHEIGVKQVALYLWSKFSSSHRVSFISIPFEDVVTEIFKSTHETYMGVVLKRLMLKAAQKVADEMGIDALVTGESIAQVSSQTLRNLSIIDQATDKLVLRPLCTMNKPEIIKIANDIGTRRFAESMPEYCGVISKNPITYGSFKRIEKEHAKFDYNILHKAVENAIKVNVDEIPNDIKEIGEVEEVTDISSSNDYIVVDIRQTNECIKAACETIKIPFYKLKGEFKKLPKDKTYLFYCDKGILSQLHAQYLRDQEGYENIKVYRPFNLV